MAIEATQATVVRWGHVVFHLNNAAFCNEFLRGRDYYEIDETIEKPQRATRLTAEEVLTQIAVPYAKTGHYHFDREAIRYLEEYLGSTCKLSFGPVTSPGATDGKWGM
jgi:hypothetical protein